MTKGDDFTCAKCGQTFTSTTTEEERIQEQGRIFGKGIRDDEVEVICEGCWNEMDLENNPHLVEQAVAETLRERVK